jgi:hypothetical protein
MRYREETCRVVGIISSPKVTAYAREGSKHCCDVVSYQVGGEILVRPESVARRLVCG